MRLIGGVWRGRLLPVVAADGLRPTSDRVRETLFNWLAPRIAGARCLDLFAGTGALGFEAVSRGASEAVLIDANKRVAGALMRTANTFRAGAKIQVRCTDALRWLNSTAITAFAVVFVDPPYASGAAQQVLKYLGEGRLRQGWLHAGASVYFETAVNIPLPVFPSCWSLERECKAGQVRYYLFSTS